MLEFEKTNIHVRLVAVKELYTLLFFGTVHHYSSDNVETYSDEDYMLQLPSQLLPNCESLDVDISKSSIFVRLYLH